MHYLGLLLYAWLAIIGWEVGKAIWRRRKTPLRWTCKRCGFTVQTDDPHSFEVSVSSHNHVSSEEYK